MNAKASKRTNDKTRTTEQMKTFSSTEQRNGIVFQFTYDNSGVIQKKQQQQQRTEQKWENNNNNVTIRTIAWRTATENWNKKYEYVFL